MKDTQEDIQEGNVTVLDPEVSLIRGGPFYRAQCKARLILPRQWNLGRRVIFAVALGWIPVVLLTALFRSGALGTLLTDYRVTSRMLIAVPILLLGQVLMESRFRMIVSQVREDLVAPQNWRGFDGTIAGLMRLRDSVLPELAIASLVCLLIGLTFNERTGLASLWAVEGAHLTPAGLYYALVSRFIYQFLVGLGLWKWMLWTFFIFKMSRMKLQLRASHPDKHAGLGFLGMSVVAFAPVALAISAAVGATWRHEILYDGARLMSFKFPAIALLILAMLVAVGPLVLFVPKLAALRRKGILEYGSLAQLHSSEFHEKWILHRKGHEAEFLAAPEISSLTDLASSFHNIEEMKPVPVGKGSLLTPALSVVIPMLPAIAAVIPLKIILKSLLEAMK